MIKGNDAAVIVDVRLPSDYKQGHLPGAINIPNGMWHKTAGLRRDKPNVLYCYSQTCHLAAQAALEFVAAGFPVMEMEGGYAGWQAAGYPIEEGTAREGAGVRRSACQGARMAWFLNGPRQAFGRG